MQTQERLRTAVRSALDRSRWDAAHGRAPSTRLVEGSQSRVWDVLTNLRSTARHEYLGLDDPSYLTAASVPEEIIARGPNSLRPLIERQVAVRQVTTRQGMAVDDAFGTILWRAGARARVVERRLPLKACVLDRRVAAVPVDLAVMANGFVITRDATVVRLVVAEHHGLWTSGSYPDSPAGTGGSGGGARLPPHLMTILPLLRDGISDEVAALRIGVSPRTYSRRVKELFDLLGARSRFDAGMEVARRGWL